MRRTRRESTTRLPARRKITRRKSRRATWVDLLQFHSATTTSAFQGYPVTSTKSGISGEAALSKEGTGAPVPIGDHNRSISASTIPQNHIREDSPENPVSVCKHADVGMDNLEMTYHEVEDGSFDHGHDRDEEQSEFLAEMELLLPDYDSENTGNDDIEGTSASADLDIQRELSGKSFPLTPSTMMALTLVCGSVRFTVKQYEIVRNIVKHSTDDTYLPSYSTVQRSLLPHVMQKLFPRSELKSFPKKTKRTEQLISNEGLEHANAERAGATDNDRNTTDGYLKPVGTARVVFPTEWAKIDVSTLPYYRNIFPYANETLSTVPEDQISIEDSLIVRDRAAIISVMNKLFVEDRYGRRTASNGDEIVIELETIPSSATCEEMLLNKFNFATVMEQNFVTGSICTSWCVGTDTTMSSSARVAIEDSEGAIEDLVQKFAYGAKWDTLAPGGGRRRSGRKGQRFFTTPTAQSRCLIAGDLCTLLRPQYLDKEEGLFCLLVSRFWKSCQGTSSQFVIWVRVRQESCNPMEVPKHFIEDIEKTIVKGAPRIADSFAHVVTKEKIPQRNRGTLPDGCKYVVYRALLYCDDFKESSSLFSSKSAGGVYLLPLGMTPQARSSRTAVHVISLTPPGVSTNDVLLHIVPDIIAGTKDGVDGVLPSGEKVKIFLDIVGFIADYPAAVETIDVIGHTGDSPCTHCNIRKFKRAGSSNLGHTTDVHAMNSATFRCGERHKMMRENSLSDRDANILGMKATREVTDRSCPLLALQGALEEVQNDIPVNDQGMPVVPGLFDAFRSNLIAPDHLLTGLARNVLDVCFQVSSHQSRKIADVAICSALAENGLIKQRSVYDAKKVQLYSASLSSVYCILLVAPPVFSNFVPEGEGVRNEALRLLKDLQKLVALTQWKPQVSCDGEAASKLINIEGGRAYISTLQGMAQRYVASVHVFCTKHPEIGAKLDKPNLHRLLELYFHTIPAFGHVTLVQELVFETAHQPLKRCVSRGNNREAEVSAVEHCMGNDWQSRLALLQELMNSSDPRESSTALKGLCRLLTGPGRDKIERGNMGSNRNVLIEKLEKDIKNMFTSPVIHILRSNGNINTALAGNAPYWTTTKAEEPEKHFDPDKRYWDVKGLVKRGEAILKLKTGCFNGTQEKMKMTWRAKRMRRAGVASTNTTPCHEVLECGSVVQVIARRGQQGNKILRPEGNGDSVLILFVTIGFLEGSDSDCWAVAVQCGIEKDSTIRSPREPRDKDVQVLLLTDGVRRVGVYHVCAPTNCCVFDTRTREVKHKEQIITGGLFRVQTRKQGYPPRMA